MKYFEVKFTLSPYSSDACDVLSAMAGEAGFESFEETADGLLGYVQQSLFSETALQEVLADFPFDGVQVRYDIHEAEDRDWNEQWEQEGFEPITVNDTIVIHDGRHLPDTRSEISIEIDAHLAFGTGTHETTRMICAELIQYAPHARLLDCGTGTGILSICALKLGATEAVGYDIDEWSADNARHNAVINRVDDRFTSLLGDASILNKVEGTFDLVVANINRNILLADMPAFRRKMAPGATLILSGFYTADSPMLIDKAATLGLTLRQQKEDHDWACLVFS
jgi:ribosomal protein L11 methyltransferase